MPVNPNVVLFLQLFTKHLLNGGKVFGAAAVGGFLFGPLGGFLAGGAFSLIQALRNPIPAAANTAMAQRVTTALGALAKESPEVILNRVKWSPFLYITIGGIIAAVLYEYYTEKKKPENQHGSGGGGANTDE